VTTFYLRSRFSLLVFIAAFQKLANCDAVLMKRGGRAIEPLGDAVDRSSAVLQGRQAVLRGTPTESFKSIP